MKSLKNILLSSSLLLLVLLLASCVATSTTGKQESGLAQEDLPPVIDQALTPTPPPPPTTLPVRYQRASYFVDQEDQEQEEATLAAESAVKVGARITSTSGPQPLWDIMKRLAALKGMNVSWASDVDRNVLVDVNISAQDDFYQAIDNLLRQVDYYHEVLGSTIIVKYKETRQFHIAMPFIKQAYRTNIGGDVLGGGGGTESNTNVKGEISLTTDGVAINNLRDGAKGDIEFNTWHSIENNLSAVLDIWSTEDVVVPGGTELEQSDVNQANENASATPQEVTATFRRSKGGNSYFIDKPVGLITVTAPRPLLEKLEIYFKSLQKELYKQISIEAKIIEVQLDDHSSVGLNWNQILENLTFGANASFGTTYQKETPSTNSSETTNSISSDTKDTTIRNREFNFLELDPLTVDSDAFEREVTNTANSVTESVVSSAKIITEVLTNGIAGSLTLASFTFDSFIKAVDEQGKSTILSNPKLSVLNGQPALMTVGRNETYIDKVESTQDEGVVTTSVTTARALSGVGLALTANILNEDEIILNLVPVTSEVEGILVEIVGSSRVGLPIINVREMSTTVKVKNGEMLVIGGLISSISSNNDSFIPGTKNIPFFKYLFGYEEKREKKRELIILLQPRII